MSLSYANLQDRVEQFLQDTTNATYDTTELGYAIETELDRLSRYSPCFVDVIFQVESRTGAETSGSTASLITDTTESQFLSTDPTNEKVIHNITDDTWAVVLTYTSTSVMTLSADIMDDDEEYEIYNKRCRNKRQIYIGDMPQYLWVESVEYPIGTERNFFQISRDVIELDVYDDTIQDSDSTLDPPNNVDVLVRFAMPHVLCQLTDLAGELSASAVAAATTIAIDGMGSTEVIETGGLFNLENQRTTYIVVSDITTSANAATVAFYPPLEAIGNDNDDITFVKSTLLPNQEDLLERMVISRAVQSDMVRFAKSGAPLLRNYQLWINNNPLMNPVLIKQELEALAEPRTSKELPR